MRVAILVCILVVLSGCALPPPDITTGGFVTGDELEATGLVREGLGFLKQSRYVDAELSFRRASYLFPDADNVRENLAIALMGSQQFVEADDIFVALVKKYPQGARHRANLAQSYYQQRRYQESIALFETALELAFSRRDFVLGATVLRSLAAVSDAIGNGVDALCYSQEALALKNDGLEALSHARLLLEHNRHSEVIGLLSQVTTVAPDMQVESMRMIALAAYGTENYRAAGQYCRRALDILSPTDPRAHELELVLLLAEEQDSGGRPVESRTQGEALRMLSKGARSQEQVKMWPANLVQDLSKRAATVLGN